MAATSTEAEVPGEKKVQVATNYAVELSNYLLTLHGDLDCVNHFSLAFYKDASGWLCRNHRKLT